MGYITGLKWYHWLLILAITANSLTTGTGGGPWYTLGSFLGTTVIVAGVRAAWPSSDDNEEPADGIETEQAA